MYSNPSLYLIKIDKYDIKIRQNQQVSKVSINDTLSYNIYTFVLMAIKPFVLWVQLFNKQTIQTKTKLNIYQVKYWLKIFFTPGWTTHPLDKL